ncbi:MAG: helix-turn-helix transcriptional regulator [Chitinophagaceae bacterium]|nr:helix-turn-helix transcriptional regulator [Chitinophagaceae bacterium]
MVHLGKNISSLRSFRRIPQKEMASKLNMAQQEYSRLESKEEIDDDLLIMIAEVLDFPVEAIKHMDSSATIQTVYQQSGNNGNGFYVNANEKIIEMYERLLSEKDQVIQMQKDVIEMFKNQQKAS